MCVNVSLGEGVLDYFYINYIYGLACTDEICELVYKLKRLEDKIILSHI